jgi:hypothetical protein
MSTSLVAIFMAAAVVAQADRARGPSAIQQQEIEYQSECFQQWWSDDLVWKLDDLPTEAVVPAYRVPYSGHDYPDKAGGTMHALSKYDRAFNNRALATEHERRDVGVHRRGAPLDSEPRGPLVRLFSRIGGPRTPGWYGHCNGWTAAAIRHAEPQNNVVRNGVVFTPADIKGLLAEIYMYSETEFLGGVDAVINPGTLHVVLSNWLGRGAHPVGMETAVGEVVINYPIYSYKSSVTKLSDRQAEVQTSIRYAMNTNREYDKGPKANQTMSFHYVLDLDKDGAITGGRFYGDSSRIDMLWVPLKPVQGGEKGNERGNPYVNVKEVLAIWRESVPEAIRSQWLNVDPTDEDRIVQPESQATAAEGDSAEPKPAAENTDTPNENE